MQNKHSFIDYKFAKRIVNDVPKIIKNLDAMKSLCYDYLEYKDINSLMFEINEIQALLRIQYEYYNEIYKGKAVINDDNKR